MCLDAPTIPHAEDGACVTTKSRSRGSRKHHRHIEPSRQANARGSRASRKFHLHIVDQRRTVEQ